MSYCRSFFRSAVLGTCALAITALAQGQSTTFNFTGSEQTYTVPAGASGVIILAAGAGGAGGGADAQGTGGVGAGRGGSGGNGVTASGTYLATSGTQLKIYVGGGGAGGITSSFGFTCTNSAGVAGSAGGVNGLAGGAGALPGCGGYSGGGGGGGGASVVNTSANVRLFVAGGGGGGQGGSWESIAIAPSTASPSGTVPGSAGAAGASPGAGDGGGGGGGGGGCPGGVGGSVHNDQSDTANGTASRRGGSCAAAGVTGFSILAAAGGAGGAGSPADPTTASNPRGTAGGSGSVILTPVFPTLNLVKSQPSPVLAVGTNSVYTLTVRNTGIYPANSARVVDQLPSNVSFVSSSGTGWTCVSAANASGTLVTCSFTGTIVAGGGTSALQITVNPTTNATVTNYASVDPSGAASPPSPGTCTADNMPSAGCAAPVVSGVGLGVIGTVYLDANHNANFEAGEAGVGGTRYVKLAARPAGACIAQSTIPAALVAANGSYSLAGVGQGNYCLILDDNATLADVTPALPAGTVGTENGTGVIQFTVAALVPSPQNFGFFAGSQLTGVVFNDNGAGAGSANNGVRNGSEPALPGVPVRATAGVTLIDSTLTAADGSYTLWLPTGTGAVFISPMAPVGYLSTGGSAGTTGGTYTRPSVSYTPTVGIVRTGVNFGLVPSNSLSPNAAQTAEAGNPVFYDHVFTAGSAGDVTFSMVSTANPVSPTWSQVLYHDNNCNGTLDTGELQVTAALTLTAAQSVCLIVKQFVPAGAPQGTQNTLTLTAAFAYTGATPALSGSVAVTASTTVGPGGVLVLSKLASNITQGGAAAVAVSAMPGDTLQYAVTAINNGSQNLASLFVSDATPAFTTYLSAACPATLPLAITACSISAQPAINGQGGLQWTFTGSLAPGAQLTVTYQVRVNQ